jgi:NAD+ synthase
VNLLPHDPNTRTALVIVDMQVFFFTDLKRRTNLPQVIQNINRAIDACDRVGLPVVHAISQYKADRSDWDLRMLAAGVPELIEGSPETSIMPEITVRPGHIRVVKTRYSAFFRTSLAEMLAGAGVGRVIAAGAYTHYCVNATVFDAYGHNFIPGMLVDGVLSHRITESRMIVARMHRNGYHLLTTDALIDSIAPIEEGKK